MNRLQLVLRSVSHHWRTNLAVLLGVVAGTAVIGGALIVGDSVRASLVKMTLDRLGRIDYVLSGPRFVREELANELREKGGSLAVVAPAIIMQAGLQAKSGETTRRAGQVNVYGFDPRAWSLIETAAVELPTGNGVVLNARSAEAVGAKVGDEVTLWIELPSAVPRDTLLGKKDNDSQEITLKVSGISQEESGLSRLGLHPTQALPLNAFVDLHVLQERLGLEEVKPTRRDPTAKPARVNAVLAKSWSEPGGVSPRTLGVGMQNEEPGGLRRPARPELRSNPDVALHQRITLADLNLRLVEDKALNCLVLESEQMILEDKLAEAARQAADELKLATSPVMVYLANKIWNPRVYEPGKDQGNLIALAPAPRPAAPKPQPNKPRAGYSMYSTVAGLDVLSLDGTPFGVFEFLGEKPAPLGEDEVVINEFLATDLQAKVGDAIKFSYHTIGSRGELPELERTVTVRGIVKMSGAAIDQALTPAVKGITDVDSLSDWDQPFEMDLDAVTPRDDEYWDSYRATPKIFLPLQQAQKLWPSRYGSLTSLRLAKSGEARDERQEPEKKVDDATSSSRLLTLSSRLLAHIDPAELGLAFQPVKAIGLMAAKGSNDFSGLFIGFSLFLIAAAMILIGLLFRLGIEQRVRDLGLLGAVGFTPQQVRRQMLLEGLIVVLAGAILGTFAAVGYAKLMIYGLTHWWVGAIGTKNLILSVQPLSLIAGFGIAVATALFAIWWALRQLNGLSLREQLAGVTEKEVDLTTQRRRARKAARRATIAAALALGLTAAIVVGVLPATGAFFGVGILLLVASLSFLSAWLQGEVRSAECGVRSEGKNSSTSALSSSSLRTPHSEFRTRYLTVRGRGAVAFSRLGLRNASRQRLRSVMTAGLIATATFLIVTVAAFRRDPTGERLDKKSGNGGFTLVAESSSPILYDINTAEGRKKLQIEAAPNSPAAAALAAMNVVPFRVKPGEEASCLNVYQTRVPTILGVPRSLIEEGRFAFAPSFMGGGSWKVLEGQGTERTKGTEGSGEAEEPTKIDASSDHQPSTLNTQPSPIPVLGDMNTLMFSLHKQVGQTIAIPNEEQPQHRLKVSGMFQDSVFQGVLVMSEDDFLKLFPEQKGFRYFLIEVPTELADAATTLLETELSAYGFDVEPVAERLARFLSVQNTYLSTFQTLGGLGLLLGTFGLATVMLRNVLERQTELALLRAVGFRAGQVASLVLWENAFVLLWGLAAGTLSALIAVAPNLTSRGGDVPLGSLATLLAMVFATGMLAATIAVRAAVRLPIVTTLRGE
ncbi:MAG: FtsX-like permease family protein [Planctomycetota bacterium]